MNEIQEIKIALTLAEVNQILDALGSVPYRQVFQLIAKIQIQAEAQLQPPASSNSLPIETQIVSE